MVRIKSSQTSETKNKHARSSSGSSNPFDKVLESKKSTVSYASPASSTPARNSAVQNNQPKQSIEKSVAQNQANPTLTVPDSMANRPLQWKNPPLPDWKQSNSVSKHLGYKLERTEENPWSTKTSHKVDSYKSAILKYSKMYNVDPHIIAGIIKQESNYNPKAVSHCGAMGLMQLMPQTAKDLGVKDAFNPEQNIEGGTKYISQMLEKYDGNLDLALAAYNAGPGNVQKYGNRVPPFKETQHYVKVVSSNIQDFRTSGTFKKGRGGNDVA